METNRTKGPRGPILRIVFLIAALVIIIAVLLVVFLRPFDKNTQRETVKIAARSDVIDYFQLHGITTYLEETTNTNIQWKDYGTVNLRQLVEADRDKDAKDVPDAYLGLGLTKDEISAIAPELFLNISNIVFSDTKVFSQIINDDTSRLPEMQIDGQIYSFPTLREMYSSEYPQKAWINADWLEAIGASVPTTTDELFAVLRQFRDLDPNGNGARDEVPLGVAYNGARDCGFGFLINAFITTDYDLSSDSGYMNIDSEGNIYTAVTRTEFAAALKYIQLLFREELVSSDAFTTGSTVYLSSGVGDEIYGVVAAPDIAVLFNNYERASHYVPMPPLNGGNQATEARRTPIQTGGYMIAKGTTKQSAVLRIGDALLSMEGTLSTLYGIQEVGWGYADSRIASMGGTETKWKKLAPNEEELPVAVPMWMSASLIMSEQAAAEYDGSVNLKSQQNWQGYLNQITRELYEPVGRQSLKYFLANYPDIVLDDSQERQLAQAGGNIRMDVFEHIYTETQRFVTTNADIDAEFPVFVQSLQEKGLGTLMELLQQAYNSRMK